MRKVYLGNTQIAITPEGNQDINTLDEVDVSEKATARISAEERAKIIPENIKKDVTILGKTGTFEGSGGSNVNSVIESTLLKCSIVETA